MSGRKRILSGDGSSAAGPVIEIFTRVIRFFLSDKGIGFNESLLFSVAIDSSAERSVIAEAGRLWLRRSRSECSALEGARGIGGMSPDGIAVGSVSDLLANFELGRGSTPAPGGSYPHELGREQTQELVSELQKAPCQPFLRALVLSLLGV